ncbi:amidase [Actinophytocola algeriensis]|uniref:Amidase n=1 Tax=Actinophytocola algeriensis TaxID=1768010 RepID=A0A7W7VIC2_9PSEU|nr:amidase [Actinophytocola algeriensis]MBB4911293.1 amidase [Actinophytocola algeriensis]MBE1479232.1 amidase [Actinophytocola algeriensis]
MLAAQATALTRGETTSVQLTQDALDQADATQPTLNAFRRLRRDAALVEAKDADRRLAAGERLPLLGVPIAIKDDMDLAGEPTAFGCAGDYPVATGDGVLVRQLRAAGAVIVGKTNTPEFGLWPITEGEAFGVTRNPWHLDHTPGGSSGGSAAAVAAGIVAAAVGSDGAGSIRIPAAWTHLVGIKPGRGTLPTPAAFNGITEWGPLARTTADAALLLDVLAGESRFRAAADRAPRRLRVALSLRPAFMGGIRVRLDPQVRAAVVGVARHLNALGHEIVVDDPSYGLLGLTFLPRSLAGVEEWCAAAPDRSLLDFRTSDTGRMGARLAGRALTLSNAAQQHYRRKVGRLFERVDVVLAPTTATPPLPVGAIDGLSGWRTDRTVMAACPYAWPWNALGWPGMNVPAGLTGEGLPVGAQLLAPRGGEELLISLAAQLESVLRWDTQRP